MTEKLPSGRAIGIVGMAIAQGTLATLRAKQIITNEEADSLLDGILVGIENILPSSEPDVQEARVLLETMFRTGLKSPPADAK
jgi:hypothetical protein